MPNAALVQFVVGGRLSWSLSGVVRGEGRRGAWSDAVAMMEYARGRVVIGGGRGGRAMQVVVQEEGIVGLENHVFGPPKNEGADLLVELIRDKDARVPVLLGVEGPLSSVHAHAILFVKVLPFAQEPWHQEIKQGPDLKHVVLHRRSCQDQPVLRL